MKTLYSVSYLSFAHDTKRAHELTFYSIEKAKAFFDKLKERLKDKEEAMIVAHMDGEAFQLNSFKK